MAEAVGFEPTDSFPSAVFKTASLSHSLTLPKVGQASVVGPTFMSYLMNSIGAAG